MLKQLPIIETWMWVTQRTYYTRRTKKKRKTGSKLVVFPIQRKHKSTEDESSKTRVEWKIFSKS